MRLALDYAACVAVGIVAIPCVAVGLAVMVSLTACVLAACIVVAVAESLVNLTRGNA